MTRGNDNKMKGEYGHDFTFFMEFLKRNIINSLGKKKPGFLGPGFLFAQNTAKQYLPQEVTLGGTLYLDF
jgi:hypothetical protein